MKERKLRTILAAALALALLFAVPSGADTSGAWSYSVQSDGTAAITGYSGSDVDIVIPDEISGYTVTAIGESAFRGNTRIISVEIPDSVVTIGMYAFEKCSALLSVSIGSGVNFVDFHAFNDCSSLIKVNIKDVAAWCGIEFVTKHPYYNDPYYGGSANPLNWGRNLYLNNQLVKTLVIPEGVVSIKAKTFVGCRSIKNIILPSTLMNIGTKILYNSNRTLQNVYYPLAEEDWNYVSISSDNDDFTSATFHFGVLTTHPIEEVPVVEASCTEPGVAEHWRCMDCGKLFADAAGTIETTTDALVVPALGHAVASWTTSIAATCTATGSQSGVCSRCGESVTRTLAALGHAYSEVVTAPGCATGGFTTHTCSRCGDSYVDSETYPLGHQFVDGVCSVCGEKEPAVFLYGDANGDGVITSKDITLLRRYLANYDEATGTSTIVLGPQN